MSDPTASPWISIQNCLLGLPTLLVLTVGPGCAFEGATPEDGIEEVWPFGE